MRINNITFLLVLLLLSGVTNLYSSGQSSNNRAIQTGTLSYLEGDVFINNSPGSIGDTVNDADTIKTGENSYCEIIFGQANLFRLDENTQTQINWSQSDIKLEKGAISAVFTKLDKFFNGDKEFTVSSPTNVAGVRGTVFFMKLEDNNNTYLCICNGALTVGGPEEELDIASDHHKAYRFTKVGSTVTTTSPGLLYHDDEKMESAAEKIDYIIPWDVVKYGY